MRICFVTFEYPPSIIGGAGGYAQNLVHELAMRGHQVYVVAPVVRGKPPEKSVENVYLATVPIIDRPILRSVTYQLRLGGILARLLKQNGGFDVLHVNGTGDPVRGRVLRYPRVVTAHHAVADIQQRSTMAKSIKGLASEQNPLIAYVEKRILSSAHQVISVSEATKNFLVRHYSIPPEKVTVVYNGVYAHQYEFTEKEVMDIRKKFGVGDGEKLLLAAPGRIDEPRKGIQYLLEALPAVLKAIPVKCIITGSGQKNVFGALLGKLPTDSVRFPGRIPEIDKRQLFAACDLFVMPSLLEGSSLAILEAMASGVPIVATDTGGIPELVKQGRNGLLVEIRNSGRLAEAIVALFNDVEKMKQTGKNNYEDARRKFTWQVAAKLTEEVYKKAIAGAGKGDG